METIAEKLTGILLLVLVTSVSQAQVDPARLPPPADHTVEFAQEIEPIFEGNCLQCHGAERPKSGFRLTDRESALKGGDLGVDIVPGDSAGSPLIHYVAGLVEDMQMPPEGRGDPLTPAQIGLLRAWIDQGASWTASEEEPKLEFSISPMVRWISVDGNEAQFREHTWMREGWGGGLRQFELEQRLDPRTILRADGRAEWGAEDFEVRLRLDRQDVGFVSGGFEHYRKWFDDTGGYHPAVGSAPFSLDDDLSLDLGRVWIDAGLVRPHWPEIAIGYEYRTREGDKSTLQWGAVDNGQGTVRNIFPAAKEVDEQVHRMKLDVSHQLAGVSLDNQFRAELYDLETKRNNVLLFSSPTRTLEKGTVVREGQDDFRATEAFRLEKQVRPWLFLSGGYLFSLLEGEAAFSQSTFVTPASSVGLFPDDKFWFSRSIVLEQSAHTFNANTLLGPWQGLSLSAGLQNQWLRQEGIGDVRLDEGIGTPAANEDPAALASDLDQVTLTERVGLRYTRVPRTVLFAEGRWEQERLDQFEEEVGGHHEFLRDTDAASDLEDYRAGFTVSPTPRWALNAHYRFRNRVSDYDHEKDQLFGGPGDGYSAFIRSRQIRSREAMGKITARWASWLKNTLAYQYITTDYFTETDPLIIPEIIIPGLPPFPAQVLTPGESLRAGEADSHRVSFSTSVRPVRRLQMTGTFVYEHSRTHVDDDGLAAVADYEGETYSLLSFGSYQLNEKTSLTAGYDYSWADYGQRHFSEGLPLGIRYSRHAARAGLSRRIRDNITAGLHYVFFGYDEPSRTGFGNYTAHGVFTTLRIVFN